MWRRGPDRDRAALRSGLSIGALLGTWPASPFQRPRTGDRVRRAGLRAARAPGQRRALRRPAPYFQDQVAEAGSGDDTHGPRAVRMGDGDGGTVVELAAGSDLLLSSLARLHPDRGVGARGLLRQSSILRLRGLCGPGRSAERMRSLRTPRSGGDIAVAFGADPAKVSVLGNTSDTVALRRAVLAAREQSEEDARAEIGVSDGPYVAVIGGLDASKRVDLLASTLDVLWERRSPARFVVAGRGHLEHLLDPAVEREQVHSIGYAGDREKALMARLCMGIFNPGRVGLIAPESFALGLPIVTARSAFHAPEFEYLRPGFDSIVTNDSPEALATALDEARGPTRRSRSAGSRRASLGSASTSSKTWWTGCNSPSNNSSDVPVRLHRNEIPHDVAFRLRSPHRPFVPTEKMMSLLDRLIGARRGPFRRIVVGNFWPSRDRGPGERRHRGEGFQVMHRRLRDCAAPEGHAIGKRVTIYHGVTIGRGDVWLQEAEA